MKLKVLILIVILLLSPLEVFSQSYYGDLKIDVNEKGTTSIRGLSNIPELETPLTTDSLTSKKGVYWTFNLTTNETLNSYVYELKLPKDANINYIETTPHFRIEENNGHITIIGSDNDKPLNIVLQYKISSNTRNTTDMPYLVLLGIFIILSGLFGYIINSWLNKNKNRDFNKKTQQEYKLEMDTTFLSKRQKEIIEIIMIHREITQKHLESLLLIPKSSLSRNLKTLEIKGYIFRKNVGQTVYIVLKS